LSLINSPPRKIGAKRLTVQGGLVIEKFLKRKAIFAIVAGLAILCFAELVPAQVSPKQEPAGKQANISDKELKAFVKAYVEYQRIRQEYEPAVNSTQDPKEKQRLQDEGNAKLKKVLDKEGLSPETYNRIFETVNTDKQLRSTVLKMVTEQRKKS
jgi:hypothetical protein